MSSSAAAPDVAIMDDDNIPDCCKTGFLEAGTATGTESAFLS